MSWGGGRERERDCSRCGDKKSDKDKLIPNFGELSDEICQREFSP